MCWVCNVILHYCGVIMGAMASQNSSLTIVYWTVHSGPDQRKHQNSASLAFVRGIHRRPVNSPHKGPVTRKMFPFNNFIMRCGLSSAHSHPYKSSTYTPVIRTYMYFLYHTCPWLTCPSFWSCYIIVTLLDVFMRINYRYPHSYSSCHVRIRLCIYSRDELFMRSLDSVFFSQLGKWIPKQPLLST